MTRKSLSVTAVATMLLIASVAGYVPAGEPNHAGDYFAIQVVDRQTGRGVPLVELRTTNSIRYVTDSDGIVAFLEPGLMDREVFFFVESHGYKYPKDGFGMQGVRLRTTPGSAAVVRIDRLNIAERLYRVTGQGIYRDSVLAGRPVPLKHPVLNGQVMGQDSVFTCLYRGRLFWMWGDTGRPSYPLGNFAMSGAMSDLPRNGGLDPAVGVDLEYFVDENGFSRKMAPLKEPGLVWLDGLMTVRDPQGNERMVAKFARLKGLAEVLERGLMVFNDDTETFEPLVRPGLEFLPYRNTGHAFRVDVQGRPYYYFTSPSPMGARLRVPARWDAVVDANQYEVLTALMPEEGGRRPEAPTAYKLQPAASGATTDARRDSSCHWVTFGELIVSQKSSKAAVIEALEDEAKDVRVYDVESGQAVVPHNGTVYFNAYRQRWIGIFVQVGGSSSYLGEVWYAEADTPVGPWAYARKIATHNEYSFYNPKHHPLFDQDGGRTIFFEGTYSWTFSGSEEAATPRYDYNQIMYRLSLNDPRLVLPAPVYVGRAVHTISSPDDGSGVHSTPYLMRDAVTLANQWDLIESIAFYAVEPNRAGPALIPIYAVPVPVGKEQSVRLRTQPTSPSAPALFYALPPTEASGDNECIVPLYEYYHRGLNQWRYSTIALLGEDGWQRTDTPLCHVWRAPPTPFLLDTKAAPATDPSNNPGGEPGA